MPEEINNFTGLAKGLKSYAAGRFCLNVLLILRIMTTCSSYLCIPVCIFNLRSLDRLIYSLPATGPKCLLSVMTNNV